MIVYFYQFPKRKVGDANRIIIHRLCYDPLLSNQHQESGNLVGVFDTCATQSAQKTKETQRLAAETGQEFKKNASRLSALKWEDVQQHHQFRVARRGLHAKKPHLQHGNKATPLNWGAEKEQPVLMSQNLKYLAVMMTEVGGCISGWMEHQTSRVPSKTGWSHARFNWIQIPLLLHVAA